MIADPDHATPSLVSSGRKRRLYLFAPWWLKTLRRSPSRLAVMLALAMHADEDGDCWPSIETLAKITGFRRDHVIEALSGLYDDGPLDRRGNPPACLVQRFRVHNESSLYRIALDRPFKYVPKTGTDIIGTPKTGGDSRKQVRLEVPKAGTLVGGFPLDINIPGELTRELTRELLARKRAKKTPKKRTKFRSDSPPSSARPTPSAASESGAPDYDSALGLA